MVAVNEREEREALDSLGSDFVDRLLTGRIEVTGLKKLCDQLDDAEQKEQPSPWPDRLIFLALATAAGALGAVLYLGGLL